MQREERAITDRIAAVGRVVGEFESAEVHTFVGVSHLVKHLGYEQTAQILGDMLHSMLKTDGRCTCDHNTPMMKAPDKVM